MQKVNEQNEEEGIMAGKFPTLSWSEDLYTNWLTQNGVNLSVGISKEVLGTSAGKSDLGLGEKVANKVAKKYKQKTAGKNRSLFDVIIKAFPLFSGSGSWFGRSEEVLWTG